MIDKLDIYFSKVFCRMRHKTQLYNGSIDDHFHTRLQHTIEVEEIALKMATTLMKNDHLFSFNLDIISAIALLHDIGHTPFGHAGEKALHEMTSGKYYEEYKLPNFVNLGIAVGFKHNINSGLLYIENTAFSSIDIDVLDGIVKHTSLEQNENDGLDYGFEYIFNYFTKNCGYSYKDKYPKTPEGFIVAYADEIAQICSDYLDICLNYDSKNETADFSCFPYDGLSLSSFEKRKQAKKACEILINLFVECCEYNYENIVFKNDSFKKVIDDFDKVRRSFITSDKDICDYDNSKKEEVRRLFAHYYNTPEDLTNDFFGDFVYRLKRIEFSPSFYQNNIKKISPNKNETIRFIKTIKNIIESKNQNYSKKNLKEFRKIIKMYIRSIAVYISKMTDNYADHKFKKLVDNS